MRNIMVPLAVLLSNLLVGCSKGGWPTDSGVENGGVFSAGYRYIAVETLALSIDSTVRLMSISTTDMDTEGRAASWGYTFVASLQPHTEYHFSATSGGVRFDSISTEMRCGAGRISKPWIGSYTATKIAESQGGTAFRRDNPNCSIHASLGEAVVPNSSPFWHFRYRSRLDPDKHLWISVDASATVDR